MSIKEMNDFLYISIIYTQPYVQIYRWIREVGLEDEGKQGGLQAGRQPGSLLLSEPDWFSEVSSTKLVQCVGEVMAPREPGQQYMLAATRACCSCLATFTELPPRWIDLQGRAREALATSRISTKPLASSPPSPPPGARQPRSRGNYEQSTKRVNEPVIGRGLMNVLRDVFVVLSRSSHS